MKNIVYELTLMVGLIEAMSSAGARDDTDMAIPAFLFGLFVGRIYYIPSLIATKNIQTKLL